MSVRLRLYELWALVDCGADNEHLYTLNYPLELACELVGCAVAHMALTCLVINFGFAKSDILIAETRRL